MSDPTSSDFGPAPQRPKRPSRLLRVVLVVSLALNLLFMGLMAGSVLRAQASPKGPKHRPPPPAASMMIGGLVFRDLEPKERREIRRMAEGRIGSVFKRRRQEVEALLALIGAEQLDMQALQTELAAQKTTQDDIEARVEAIWLAHVQKMTVAERKALVERMITRLDRRKKQHGQEKRGGKGPAEPLLDREDH